MLLHYVSFWKHFRRFASTILLKSECTAEKQFPTVFLIDVMLNHIQAVFPLLWWCDSQKQNWWLIEFLQEHLGICIYVSQNIWIMQCAYNSLLGRSLLQWLTLSSFSISLYEQLTVAWLDKRQVITSVSYIRMSL